MSTSAAEAVEKHIEAGTEAADTRLEENIPLLTLVKWSR